MAKVAFIVDEMFEDSEFKVPYDRLKEAGHEPVIVGLESGKKLDGKKGDVTISVDRSIDEVDEDDFDALVIPGGYSPDKIRTNEGMVAITRSMVERDKPVAAICHAGWMLAEAGVLDSRTVTSWPSIKTDLVNAGAEWVDQEVVEDGNLITSRKPDDLDAFTKTLLSQLEQRS
ncbi:MAG: type 1 glutamine amidotransferase [Actinobacteria bacterium]|nr:type 1 glutamine amidotransferase [Actinomycetota bacterium]